MESIMGQIASTRLSDELVEVFIGSTTIGFVESVGPVFVALHGPRYDRAVEVVQSLAFDVAVAGLLVHVRLIERVAEEVAALPEPAPVSISATARVA